jgi:hypothetical protein
VVTLLENGGIVNLRNAFEARFGIVPPPGMLPERPLERIEGSSLLYGTPSAVRAGTLLLQNDLGAFLKSAPAGYLLVGFWGHGFNSYAFYYARVDERSRVYFRLGYGGVYMDNDAAAARIRAFLTRWFALEPILRETMSSYLAVEAMESARYRLVRTDGTEVDTDRQFLHDPAFTEHFAPILRIS